MLGLFWFGNIRKIFFVYIKIYKEDASMKKLLLGVVSTGAVLLGSMNAHASTLVVNNGLSDPAPKAAFQQMVNEFEKANPDIKVQSNVFGHEEEKIAIRNWLVSDPPDVVYWYPGTSMMPFVKPGLFADVTPTWNKIDLANKVAPGVTEQFTYNGKQWGFPYAYYMWGVYYRKDIFAKYGLPVPKTWDEFLHNCAVLKSHGITPIALGDQEAWPAAGWFDYLDMRMNGYAAHEALMHGKISYNSPSVIKVFKVWSGLIKDGYFTKDATSYKWEDGERFLFNGQSAMMLIGSFAIPDFPASEKNEIGFFQFPVMNPAAGPAEDAPIDMFTIPSGASNKAAAEKFMEFMEEPDIQSQFALGSGELPVVKGASVGDNPLLVQQAKLLSTIPHFPQFYDRDNEPQMASFGMQQFQRLLYNPDDITGVVDALAEKEKEVYGAP